MLVETTKEGAIDRVTNRVEGIFNEFAHLDNHLDGLVRTHVKPHWSFEQEPVELNDASETTTSISRLNDQVDRFENLIKSMGQKIDLLESM